MKYTDQVSEQILSTLQSFEFFGYCLGISFVLISISFFILFTGITFKFKNIIGLLGSYVKKKFPKNLQGD